MKLSIGSFGGEVRTLQSALNMLSPTALPRLAEDGIFGSKTRARVREFQRGNGLVDDGVVGKLTRQAIELALKLLGGLQPVPPIAKAVRPITQAILGVGGANHLVEQFLPSIGLIAESSFRPGVASNAFDFRSSAPSIGRLGIFAAAKAELERAVILLLPRTGVPRGVLICITQGFAQSARTLEPLGWSDPLSPELIRFCLLKHVINRWGAQTLASRRQLAFLYIVRAKGKELGPFANDGPFVRQTLEELVSLTGGAFSFDTVEAFTFSSGIADFNPFVSSLNGQLNVRAVYNIDPAHALSAVLPPGAVRKQYLSGQTGGPKAGFEFLPIQRWTNEFMYPARQTFVTADSPSWPFNYLHNHCMPLYMLHLALQT